MAEKKIHIPHHSNSKFGWVRDTPDQRDRLFSVNLGSLDGKDLPRVVDPRAKDAPIFNQYEIGSCTANSVGGMYVYELLKNGKVTFEPSRLHLYYNTRATEGTIASDAGATLRNTLKVASNVGLSTEALWPYITEKFAQEPTKESYVEALNHQVLEYRRLPQNLTAFKLCLHQGFNFVFGFMVYDSFNSEAVGATGIMPLPSTTERAGGGHAVRAVGYNDDLNGGVVIVANSWGTEWGDGGYFYMPYAYIIDPNLSSDFWSLRTVE